MVLVRIILLKTAPTSVSVKPVGELDSGMWCIHLRYLKNGTENRVVRLVNYDKVRVCTGAAARTKNGTHLCSRKT
jgi:hypothetical protein